jgi:hypothetical protein
VIGTKPGNASKRANHARTRGYASRLTLPSGARGGVAGGEVHEDGVGVGDHRAVLVDEHRHLPERVHRQVLRRLVRAGEEVDVLQRERDPEHGQRHLRAVRVAGARVVGEGAGAHRASGEWEVRQGRLTVTASVLELAGGNVGGGV